MTTRNIPNLTTVPTRLLTAPTAQDDGLCGLIAATNIASITNYDEWSCTTDGLTSTDPCAGGSEWTGVTCSTGYVSEIFPSSKGVTGIVNILYSLYYLYYYCEVVVTYSTLCCYVVVHIAVCVVAAVYTFV